MVSAENVPVKCSCWSPLMTLPPSWIDIRRPMLLCRQMLLDFAEAFDKVPYHHLLKKLKYYNLDNNVVGWVSSFLTGQTQRVVVDGYTSSEAAVLSGVPEGTVLGILLFLVFINDIIQVSSSSIHLFADDCLVHCDICSKSDCSALQSDLENLVQWSKTLGMEFDISKCNILSITNATKTRSNTSIPWTTRPSRPRTAQNI